jgi:GT2 family glycosyltransferase
MRSLSIIIPNYNGESLVKQFLPSVIEAAKAYAGAKEIIFTDDCSSDSGVAAAAELAAGLDWFKIVSASENGGFSATCNLGARSAAGEILFFLNNDVKLDPHYFETFSDYFNDAGVFSLAPCGFSFYDGRQIDGIKTVSWKKGFLRFTGNIYNECLEKKPYLSFSVQGSYFFVDRRKFETLGGFDEIYSPYVMEETDLAYRALKKGWKIVYGPEFKAYHRVGSSINSKTSRKTRIISARNRLIFTWKNIHSTSMLAEHFMFLAFRLLGCSPVLWRGFLAALKMRARICSARAKARTEAVRTDRELLNFYIPYFKELQRAKR